MNSSRLLNRSMIAACFLMISVSLYSQGVTENKDFQPYSGQAGKDVVWVPTPQPLVDKMLDMAKITPQDFLIDLGSGDGRTVITAAKRGTRAQGIEYNPDMVALSKRNATSEGVSEKAEFVKADLFETDLSKATVITLFLLPEINLKLRPFFLNLRPGTRIVSNTFTMEEWIPDETTDTGDEETNWNTAYMWIVPAKVEGTWRLSQGELILKQEFQMVSGNLKSGENNYTISNGKLRGERLTFFVNKTQYTGQVNGNTIEGIITSDGSNTKWTATRAEN
jgi:Methyltransferase domain